MGAGEEVSGVAKSAIEALRTSPSCLVAVLFGIAMAILTYLSLRDEETHMHQRQMLLIEKCVYTPSTDYHPQRSEP